MIIETKEKTEIEKAEPGDIISFNGETTGLVLESGEVALLNNCVGNSWFRLAESYKKAFKEGEYKILIKKDKWKIVEID